MAACTTVRPELVPVGKSQVRCLLYPVERAEAV
jgi:hypothetical protein